jgi:polyhydroxybutyrate depolymerase
MAAGLRSPRVTPLRFGIGLLLAAGCKASTLEHQLPAQATGGAAGSAAVAGASVLPEAGAAGATLSMPASAGTLAGQSAGTSVDAAAGHAADGGVATQPPPPPDAAMPDAAVAPPDAGPPAPVCPSTPTLKPGDSRAMLQHDGMMRSYLVHVPSGVKASVAVPLVLDFHGNGSNSTQESMGSGWAQKADSVGFITAYPDGVGGGWNVGNCCGQALSDNVDDVGFAKAIVAALSAATCIDPKRVYATGISNGAGLAHRLACEAADVFAAIGAASADLVTDPCKPARPISELSVRGLADNLVAYAGGKTGSTGWYSPGAKGTLDLWKGIDQCTGMPDSTKHQYCETYDHCAGGVEVTLCSLPNTGHILYTNSLGFSVPDVVWGMFVRQPMR